MKVSITYKDKKKDSVKVSVTHEDLWNGDVTLARIIYPFLKKYRKMHDRENNFMGYPSAFAPDPNKPEGPNNPDRYEEWLECLDKMIYAFGWIAKNNDWYGPERKEYSKECGRLLKPHRKELKQLAQKDDERFASAKENVALPSLEWNRRSEIIHPAFEIFHPKFEAHRKKLQEGINLFAKYFSHLWV